jgi:phytoene dehydrogenase-like protein
MRTATPKTERTIVPSTPYNITLDSFLEKTQMKKLNIRLLITATLLASALTGCVVAGPRGRAVYAAPAGVVYVAPTYAIPARGYAWNHHGHHGWGWHHPRHGWHRGWR